MRVTASALEELTSFPVLQQNAPLHCGTWSSLRPEARRDLPFLLPSLHASMQDRPPRPLPPEFKRSPLHRRCSSSKLPGLGRGSSRRGLRRGKAPIGARPNVFPISVQRTGRGRGEPGKDAIPPSTPHGPHPPSSGSPAPETSTWSDARPGTRRAGGRAQVRALNRRLSPVPLWSHSPTCHPSLPPSLTLTSHRTPPAS